jgi:hypothetical protein
VVYGPVSGFVLNSSVVAFPAFIVLGITALLRDAGKGTAIKVIAIAAVCTALVLL